MVARETVIPWWWARCQPMVSGPASSPVAVSFCPELDDQLDHFGRDRGRGGLGSPGPRREDRLAFAAVTLQEQIDPGLGDAVLDGDVTDRSVLDHNGGDHQAVDTHRRSLEADSPGVRDPRRHQSSVS